MIIEKLEKFDFLKFLLSKKKIIVLFVLFISITTGIFIYQKKELYKIETIIKLGELNNKVLVNDKLLVQDIVIKFKVGQKSNLKSNGYYIESVNTINDLNQFIKITTVGYEKKILKNKNKAIFEYLKSKYNYKIETYKSNILNNINKLESQINFLIKVKKIELQKSINELKISLKKIKINIKENNIKQLKNIENNINQLKLVELISLENKIKLNENKINDYRKSIEELVNKKDIDKSYNSFISIQLLSNQNLLLSVEDKLENLKKEKKLLVSFRLKNLEEKKESLKKIDLVESYNLKNKNVDNKIKDFENQLFNKIPEKIKDFKFLIELEKEKISKKLTYNSYIIEKVDYSVSKIDQKKLITFLLAFLGSTIFIIFILIFRELIKIENE